MSSYKACVNDGGKVHTIILPDLTMESLRQQILQATQSAQTNNVLITITDGNDGYIEADEDVINAFKSDTVYFTVHFQSGDISKLNRKKSIPEALDFKRHWNRQWRKANVEAAKTVEQMMCNNEKGLIIVAYKAFKGRNRDGNLSPIVDLVMNEKEDIRDFKEYCMYTIKRKLIVLEHINIDGSVYVVDCKFECKKQVNITTQMFVTKDAIINEQLKQSISPIPWNTEIHCNIPTQFQELENKKEECTQQNLFDESIMHLHKYLQIAIDIFGFNHHYVAFAYNMIGNVYNDNKGQTEKALEFYIKSLKLTLNIFGVYCNFVAQLYENIGSVYVKKMCYDKVIEYYEMSLKIRVKIFNKNHIEIGRLYTKLGIAYEEKELNNKAIECYENSLTIAKILSGNTNRDVADSFWNLGLVFTRLGNSTIANKYFEEAWKIYSMVLGEWDKETLQAKWKIQHFK
ncbi:hypothetical protein RFI_10127 [Reticulomyxa filosa]|uniref:Uncharacterized protein n=1 Tax=Reticulomyxa filosa TaxID=46433 RepID=X6NL45_RETFI|nr:hypothetical protein RFI_10127 [Reticulomyxa filosa]|eukprot:ETO27005.1 hypothetical protein RFI_10127 [Reticulomyxa filosa]